jgi:hypothetical protein
MHIQIMNIMNGLSGVLTSGITPMYVPVILLVALGPGVYSASNRNEYQKHKNNVSGE